MISTPGGSISCTSTASNSGAWARVTASSAANASRTSASEVSPSRTPPTSVLCAICGELTFIATRPIPRAASHASSAVRARTSPVTGSP